MSSKDEILEFLVKKVDQTGVGSGITLCVNGLIVTGTLMRSQLYYDEMFRFFDDTEITTKDKSDIEQGRKYYEEYKRFMKEMKEKSNPEKREDNPEFIHLSDVMIYPSSDLLHPFYTDLWRGRLSSVDGFYIGYQRELKRLSEENE
jgi:hypothetical protein